MNQLKLDLRKFTKDRNWESFHSPKNLAMALSVEVAELVEIFQWMTEEESYLKPYDNIGHIMDEIGDIMIYLTMIADCFYRCPIACAKAKIIKNEIKHPIT